MPRPTTAAKSKAARPPARLGSGRLEFFVDPRLELDGVVELLAFDLTAGKGEPPHATDFMHPDVPYVRAARAFFAEHKKHPAVASRAKPGFRAFDLGQRGQGLMRLSALPELARHSQLSIGFLAHYVGGDSELDRYLRELRAFCKDAGFLEFFEKNKGLLDEDLARAKAAIEKVGFLEKIEAYTGLPFEGRYAFVLSPFVACDTGANIVQRGDDGLPDIVSVIGPINNPRRDGPIECTYPRLHARVWHEAAHGVLDNVTELYGEDIAAKQPPAPKPTREYQNWMHHVREHMVRSVMLRLVAHELGDAHSDEELQHEEDCGLPHLRTFKARIIAEYEAEGGRGKFPTFADFYPRLLDLLPRPAKTAAAAPLARESDPYRDWVTENAMPFYTEPQRRRALWYLDLMLSRSQNAGLLLKRACLLQLLGEREKAAADADAVLSLRPGDEGALRVKKAPAATASGGEWHGTGPDPSQSGGGAAVRGPGHGPEAPRESSPAAERLNEAGMKAYLAGKHAEALARFEEALRLSPGDPRTLINAAVVLADTGKHDRALEAYEKAIERCLAAPSPESRATAAAAMSSRASLHERAKRAKDARADLERALQLAPPGWEKRPAVEKRLKGLS